MKISSREEIEIDHDGKYVIIHVSFKGLGTRASLSPAEAKALATALVHYAELAQKVRDREDERDGN